MTADRQDRIGRFLTGFIVAGVTLVVASWLVTGVKPGMLAPFALLALAWAMLNRTADRSEDRNAR